MLWYWRWIIWKMGNSPQAAHGLPSFTITYRSLPSWGGNMPAKTVLPPKMRPITSILFKANSFWFPSSSALGVCGVTASYRCFPQSLLLWASGQNSTVAGNSRSAPAWASARINQSIRGGSFGLLRKPHEAVNLISNGSHLLASSVP